MKQNGQKCLVPNYRISQYSLEVALGHGKLDGFIFIALSFDLSLAFLCNGLGHGHVS
jgi:hypothetical protein